jgi:hypothetical protein
VCSQEGKKWIGGFQGARNQMPSAEPIWQKVCAASQDHSWATGVPTRSPVWPQRTEASLFTGRAGFFPFWQKALLHSGAACFMVETVSKQIVNRNISIFSVKAVAPSSNQRLQISSPFSNLAHLLLSGPTVWFLLVMPLRRAEVVLHGIVLVKQV